MLPIFALETDASGAADGVYIDRLRLLCRDTTYVDATTPESTYDQAAAGNYVEFQRHVDGEPTRCGRRRAGARGGSRCSRRRRWCRR